jgi:hypothetical protein
MVEERKRRQPNLLVLGASGHVAQAFLRRLGGRRDQFGALVLLDRNERVRHNRFLEHSRLRYEFVRQQLQFPRDESAYVQLLRRKKIQIVLDLTDMDTLPVFRATESAGVSYINTALNDAGRVIHEVIPLIHPTRQRRHRAAHIISSGMNPGVVNIWVMHGVRHYGVPREIVHFEYDTSMALGGWRPMITWSRREFLTETVWEPTGLVEAGRVRMLATNAIQNQFDLRPIMQPVLTLSSYPKGLLVLHEENVKLGSLLGASSSYLYAIDPRTMRYLAQCWRERGTVRIGDLEVGDNTSIPLGGADTIGVCLMYPPRRRVYYLNSVPNQNVVGTNATCTQVAVGVYAALITMLSTPLRPRVYFATDLYDTIYPQVLFSNLRVEHFLCSLRDRRWVVTHHVPELHPRLAVRREQPVI